MSAKLIPKDLVDAVGPNVKPPTTRSRRQVAAGKPSAPRMTEGDATVEIDARSQRRKDAVVTAPNAPKQGADAAVNALFETDGEPVAPQALTVPSVKVTPPPQPGKRESRSLRRKSRASRNDSSSESDHSPEPPKRERRPRVKAPEKTAPNAPTENRSGDDHGSPREHASDESDAAPRAPPSRPPSPSPSPPPPPPRDASPTPPPREVTSPPAMDFTKPPQKRSWSDKTAPLGVPRIPALKGTKRPIDLTSPYPVLSPPEEVAEDGLGPTQVRGQTSILDVRRWQRELSLKHFFGEPKDGHRPLIAGLAERCQRSEEAVIQHLKTPEGFQQLKVYLANRRMYNSISGLWQAGIFVCRTTARAATSPFSDECIVDYLYRVHGLGPCDPDLPLLGHGVLKLPMEAFFHDLPPRKGNSPRRENVMEPSPTGPGQGRQASTSSAGPMVGRNADRDRKRKHQK